MAHSSLLQDNWQQQQQLVSLILLGWMQQLVTSRRPATIRQVFNAFELYVCVFEALICLPRNKLFQQTFVPVVGEVMDDMVAV